jgi:hypothetical protein
MGKVDGAEKAVIAAAFPDLAFDDAPESLFFAVKGLLIDRPQLRNAVSNLQREWTHNTNRLSWVYSDLAAADLPPIRWLIPNLLPEGMGILGGRPKTGKSLLAMQLAAAIQEGRPFLGESVPPGSVLYLALEDTEGRFMFRSSQQGWDPNNELHLELAWEDLSRQGFERLVRRMETHRYDFVIIDTLSRAMNIDQLSVQHSSAVLGDLQHLALDFHASLLIVDHVRKHSGRDLDTLDIVEEILGSTGKTAVADVIWGLFRERRSTQCRLVATGRDLGETELILELNAQTLTWELVGEANQVVITDMERTVLDALSDLGGTSYTSELAEHLDRGVGQVSKLLGSLAQQGLVVRGEREGRRRLYHLEHPDFEESSES